MVNNPNVQINSKISCFEKVSQYKKEKYKNTKQKTEKCSK
jgi:hypothetical protein